MKKILKISSYILISLIVGASVIYNFFIFFSQYQYSLRQEGAQIAVQQIVQTVDQQKEIALTVRDASGKESKYVLIPKSEGKK